MSISSSLGYVVSGRYGVCVCVRVRVRVCTHCGCACVSWVYAILIEHSLMLKCSQL